MFEKIKQIYKKTEASVASQITNGDALAELKKQEDLKRLSEEENKLKSELKQIEHDLDWWQNKKDDAEIFSGADLKNVSRKIINNEELSSEEENFYKKNQVLVDANVKQINENTNLNQAIGGMGVVGGFEGEGRAEELLRNYREKHPVAPLQTPEFIKKGIEKMGKWWDAGKNGVKFINETIGKKAQNITKDFGKIAKDFGKEFSYTAKDTKDVWAKDVPDVLKDFKTGVVKNTGALWNTAKTWGFNPKEWFGKQAGAVSEYFKSKAPEAKIDFTQIANDIEAKIQAEIASGRTVDDLEKKNIAFEIVARAKEEKQKEDFANRSEFKKTLEKTTKWWKNLDNTKGGRITKIALSSALMGSAIIGSGTALGFMPTTEIGNRLLTRVLLATGFNSMLSSDKASKLAGEITPKKMALLKKGMIGAGLGASFVMAGGLAGAGVAVVSLGASGLVVRKVFEYLNQDNEKQTKEKTDALKNNFDYKKYSASGTFDINALAKDLENIEKDFENIVKGNKQVKKLIGIGKNINTLGVGVLTMGAMANAPEIAHAQNNTEINPTATPDQAPTPTEQPDVKSDFMEVNKGDGITQTLKRLVDENKVPNWAKEELGKDSSPKNYADFAEKYGMLHSKDIEDSIKVAEGDSFGFDDKGNFIWKHNNEDFTVVKVDEHGHHEEGDWMDKMQDEQFINTGNNTFENIGEPANLSKGAVPAESMDQNPNSTNIPSLDNGVPAEPAPITSDGSHTETTPDQNTPDIINKENPYGLNTEDLDYVKQVYQNQIGKLFTSENGVSYWNSLLESKNSAQSAFTLMGKDASGITNPDLIEQKNFIEYLQKIKSATGLEPLHPKPLNPEIPWENCKDYINRAMQYAYKNNKLNEIL